MADFMELAERCEKATGPDRELDLAIAKLPIRPHPVPAKATLGQGGLAWSGAYGFKCAEYTASLDAAMTLVPEGWNWQVGVGNHNWAAVYKGAPPSMRVDPIAATPALALCAAALRARASERGLS